MKALESHAEAPSTLSLALRLGQGDLARGIKTLAGLLESADRQSKVSLPAAHKAHGGAFRPVVRSIASGSVRTEVIR
ncbi:MAG: hypothetical protein RIG82_02195 [Phycisphaeraceae bacterium]